MHLKILLPFRIFADRIDVSRVVAETRDGSFGLLPHRLDCVAALTPGILTYSCPTDGEVFVAVDQGVLVKAGQDVFASVRHAVAGTDLSQLRATVDKEFLSLDADERRTRAALAQMESGLIRRLVALHNA